MGKSIWALCRIYYRMIRGGTKGLKRRDLCVLGRNKCEEVDGKGYKKGQSQMDVFPVSMQTSHGLLLISMV